LGPASSSGPERGRRSSPARRFGHGPLELLPDPRDSLGDLGRRPIRILRQQIEDLGAEFDQFLLGRFPFGQLGRIKLPDQPADPDIEVIAGRRPCLAQ